MEQSRLSDSGEVEHVIPYGHRRTCHVGPLRRRFWSENAEGEVLQREVGAFADFNKGFQRHRSLSRSHKGGREVEGRGEKRATL